MTETPELPEQEWNPGDQGPLPDLPESAYPEGATPLHVDTGHPGPDDDCEDDDIEIVTPGPNPYDDGPDPEVDTKP